MKKRGAKFTYSDDIGAYYFSLDDRRPPPYYHQIMVEAIVDVADDGTLAGVEIIDTKCPPPPVKDEGAALAADSEG